MSHLARATAALAVLALVAPVGALAAAKPKHTTSVRTVSELPRSTPKNLSRKCGSSKSATRIRSRRTSRPTKQRIRVKTYFCDGGTRTAFTILRRQPKEIVRTVPAAPTATPVATPITPAATATPTATPTADAATHAEPEPREFRLTLLHNNDGESKYVTGDSIANYGGVARFKTVLDKLRADADAAPVDENTDKGTLTVSSGDNFLAGLNLRASFQRFDAGTGPFYDSDAMGLLGYDAITIGNHEFDFGPARLAQFVAFERTGIPFLSANADFTGEPLLQALRDNGRIADSTVVEKGGELIGIIGVSPPETPTISAPRNVTFVDQVAAIINAEAERLTDAGVNKIIVSSHLQNIANEKNVVAQLHDVDVVISGGADDLLANPGDLLLPASTPVGPYPTVAEDARRRRRPDRHDPGRVPLRRPPDGDLRRGR